ncbi:hypothetical protein [Acidisoma sp. 7E03]
MDRFHAVFCAYRASDVGRSLWFIRQLRQFIPQISILAVSTGGGRILEQAGAEAELFDAVLADDNRRMEFGAYQTGLDHIVQLGELGRSRGVFFLNDTIGRKDWDHNVCLTYAAFAASLTGRLPVLFGTVDRYGPGVTLCIAGLPVSRWVSTCLFFADRNLLQAVGQRIAYDLVPELDNRQQGDTGDALETRFFEGLDITVAERLGDWLFRGGWYRSGALLPENYVFFRAKLRSILNEMYLSALAEKQQAISSAGHYLAFLRKSDELRRLGS